MGVRCVAPASQPLNLAEGRGEGRGHFADTPRLRNATMSDHPRRRWVRNCWSRSGRRWSVVFGRFRPAIHGKEGVVGSLDTGSRSAYSYGSC